MGGFGRGFGVEEVTRREEDEGVGGGGECRGDRESSGDVCAVRGVAWYAGTPRGCFYGDENYRQGWPSARGETPRLSSLSSLSLFLFPSLPLGFDFPLFLVVVNF